jgi:tetratricopeptide (TPR) repeat protein
MKLILSAAALLAAAPAFSAGDPYRTAAEKLAGGLPEGAKVCVLPFEYIGAEGARGGTVVAERLYAELVKDGRLKLSARSRVAEVLAGLEGGSVGEERVRKAGALLGAAYAVTGTLIRKRGGELELNARAIDPATGEVKAAAREEVLEDWLDRFPDAPAGAAGAGAYALCKKGMYALDERRFEEAAGLFSRAIAAEENGGCGMDIPGMAFMARAMALRGRSGPRDEAPEETGPPVGFTLKEQSRIGAAAGENAKKLARYGAVIKAMPDNAAAYFERGWILAKERRYREARKDLDAAIKLSPDKAGYYYARGYVLAMQRLSDNAVADFSAAIRLDPGDAKAYIGRAGILAETGRLGKALADYDLAIKYGPSDPIARSNRARCLFLLDRHAESLEESSRAVDLDPAFTEAHYWRGAALKELGRYEEAVRAFDKALELTPGYAPALEDRQEALDRKSGRYYEYAGDRDKAIKLFNERKP